MDAYIPDRRIRLAVRKRYNVEEDYRREAQEDYAQEFDLISISGSQQDHCKQFEEETYRAARREIRMVRPRDRRQNPKNDWNEGPNLERKAPGGSALMNVPENLCGKYRHDENLRQSAAGYRLKVREIRAPACTHKHIREALGANKDEKDKKRDISEQQVPQLRRDAAVDRILGPGRHGARL